MDTQHPDYDSIVAGAEAAVRSLHESRGVFEAAASAMIRALRSGGKILSAGNGGSAAEAMHLAEELSGRYHFDRVALPGMALCADPTALTCIGNDYGFDRLFSRQVEAFGREGDVLVLFSTSGNSANQILAAEAARARGMTVVGLLGRGGGKLAPLCDFVICVPGDASAHIQEAHQVLLHAFLEYIDADFLSDQK